jgi:hypothetical protein
MEEIALRVLVQCVRKPLLVESRKMLLGRGSGLYLSSCGLLISLTTLPNVKVVQVLKKVLVLYK